MSLGGEPERLAESLLEDLRRTDTFFRDLELPAPFQAFVEVFPSEAPVEVPEELLRDLPLEVPTRPQGWLGAAVSAYRRAVAERTRLEAEAARWRDGASVPALDGMVALRTAMQFSAVRISEYLKHAETRRGDRRRIQSWARDFREQWERMVYAGERYLAGPGAEDLRGAFLLRTMVGAEASGAFGPVLVREVAGVTGTPPETLAQWILYYELVKAKRRARSLRLISGGPFLGWEVAARQRLLAIEPRDPLRRSLRQWALRVHLWSYLDALDIPGVEEVLRVHGDELFASEPRDFARIGLYLLDMRRETGKELGLAPEVWARMGPAVRAEADYLRRQAPAQTERILDMLGAAGAGR